MSGRIVRDVLDHAPNLPDTEWRVLITLAEDANERDRTARYCSVTTIANRTRRAEGTVRNALSQLTARGLIRPLLKAHRGKVQHYEVARFETAHRFVTYAQNGSHPEVTHSHTESLTPDNDT